MHIYNEKRARLCAPSSESLTKMVNYSSSRTKNMEYTSAKSIHIIMMVSLFDQMNCKDCPSI